MRGKIVAKIRLSTHNSISTVDAAAEKHAKLNNFVLSSCVFCEGLDREYLLICDDRVSYVGIWDNDTRKYTLYIVVRD